MSNDSETISVVLDPAAPIAVPLEGVHRITVTRPPLDREEFRRELAQLLNRYSVESYAGDTPDFVLADYLINCLRTFDIAVQRRESYYGRSASAVRR